MSGTELSFAEEVAILPHGLTWLGQEDNRPPDGNLSTNQQG
jgi:hypothetical protein